MLLKYSRGVGRGGVAFDMGGVRSIKYLVLLNIVSMCIEIMYCLPSSHVAESGIKASLGL